MKNIQENIYRVKTLMNLLTEGSTNPKDWKVGEYYIQTRKGSNERNIIKITYKDETYISFDYVEYDEITKEKTKTGSEDKILVSQVPTQADGAIWEESNETVWNEISKSTPTTPTPTTPTPTPTTSGDIWINVNGKDNDPYDYRKFNGEKFFISKDNFETETEVKDQNAINGIKEKYIPDTLSIDSNTTFNEKILKYWKIILRDYKSYITYGYLEFNNNGQITYANITTTKDGVVGWYFQNDGQLAVEKDGEWQTPSIVDDKIVLQNPKFSDLLNPEKPDRPNVGEKEGINPKEEYIKFNVFSALADDIYRDLIEDKITNVSLSYVDEVKYNDNNELTYIDFFIKIDGKDAHLVISDKGVSLFVDNVQVKPIWDDKVLKYRPFNTNEKKTGNEWMKTQVELKLEHFKNRFKQLI
jgi:hypothetical protein